MVTATVLIMLFTGITAYVTFKMWQEKNESNIEVRLDNHPVHHSFINICVENHGPGNARDLKFKITPATTDKLLDHPIESLGFIKYGISCLNSGNRRESMLTSVIGKFEEQKKYPIQIEVEYRNLTRNSVHLLRKKTFILDFREFDLVSPVPDDMKYLQEMSKTLEKIQKNIEKFVGTSGVPRITIQSPLDYNIKNSIWPFLGWNTADKIPIDVQRQNIEKALTLIRHNPWYEIYTELSKLPPEIQLRILYDLNSKFAEWKKHGTSS